MWTSLMRSVASITAADMVVDLVICVEQVWYGVTMDEQRSEKKCCRWVWLWSSLELV